MSAAAGPARQTLAFARDAMSAAVLSAPAALEALAFAGGAHDNRTVTPGRLFFALPGERVDGFDFCAAAAQAGAAGVVVTAGRGVPAGCEAIPVLSVPDVRKALGDLARAVRARFGGRVVGVTGSNGKTTTKELVAAALSSAGVVHKTAGNFNSDVGMPLTVLEASGHEAFWVLEMAMRARGEIAYLAELGRPHVGVVTSIAAAHLGRLGSLEEIAKAKGEMFHGLGDSGIAVLPTGVPLLEAEAAHLPEARKLRFGGWRRKPTGAAADAGDVRILEFAPAGAAGAIARFTVRNEPLVARLPLAGEHNAQNAAAALAVCFALGVPLGPAAAALARTELPPHRSRVIAAGGRSILDDSYNANPASMHAAVAAAVSAAGAGRAYAVLGDMLELGDEAVALHAALGGELVGRGLAGLVGVGALGAEIARGARAAGLSEAQAVTDVAEAARIAAAWSRPGDWIVVKGSRGMRLERAVEALEALLAGAGRGGTDGLDDKDG